LRARLTRIEFAIIGALAALGIAWGLTLVAGAEGAKKRANPVVTVTPAGPTNSSPIAMSLDGKLVWSVNPGADSVSVIRTDQNKVVKTIKVGDEPESVALDPAGRYAYVANAASANLTVIRILNASPKKFNAKRDTRFGPGGNITTGSEPYDVVASPDARRVFVANSGQDTITVLDVAARTLVGHVDLRKSVCNAPDKARTFQPRGMAVTKNSKRLLVTRFLSFTRPGGVQADDNGREGAVCRVDIKTSSSNIGDYRPAQLVKIAPEVTGFTIDSTGDGVPDPTSAFPNQLQSIVIKGNNAYLPNIAASPTGPLKFNVDTQAFVNVIGGVNAGAVSDQSPAKFINLHLGARDPEPGKKKIFFANAWAVGFAGNNAYTVAAGSDLLVKTRLDGSGKLNLTVDADTTRYIDLNDPANFATAGDNAGKNPQGIVVNKRGTRAYVMNFVSRNVSVVNLSTDQVVKVIRTVKLPTPGSLEEVVAVGAEMFFSSRGHFDRPAGATASTDGRLSSDGWQSCSSCHFKGLTDSVVWQFPDGPRKSIPLNGTFNPSNPNDARAQNYSAIRDEVEDFELNVRNVSGPGALAAALPCANPPPAPAPATSLFDPNHGLLIADNGNINQAPCTINNFALKNADRQQVTVTLPGSATHVPALTALREWVRRAVRTPKGPLRATASRPGVNLQQVAQGRTLFAQSCGSCHFGGKWTDSTVGAVPPAATDFVTERVPPPTPPGNPSGSQYLFGVLRNIGSFGLGVPGGNNPIGNNIGGEEKTAATVVGGVLVRQDALGIDYNGDGKGIGFNTPSLLGIFQLPPYYHNGACETLVCVVGNVRHRTANFTRPDVLGNPADVTRVVRFLETIGANTRPLP
jgi:YVTN family beta-propeller protein